MAMFPEYQNIFNQVQVQGNPEWGMDDTGNNMMEERAGSPRFNTLVGIFGNAQLGPYYVGWTTMVAFATGAAWLFIVGFNMLAQVGWSL